MSYKPLPLTPELHAYLLDHSTPPDEVTAELIAETRAPRCPSRVDSPTVGA